MLVRALRRSKPNAAAHVGIVGPRRRLGQRSGMSLEDQPYNVLALAGDRVTPLRLRRVHGIAQMRDTHTDDDCRIPEDDRCVREVVEQPHSCA